MSVADFLNPTLACAQKNSDQSQLYAEKLLTNPDQSCRKFYQFIFSLGHY